jgi:hypothetical protein
MSESNHLEAVLQQLLQERAELDNLITALQKRIGRPASESKLTMSANPVGVGVSPTSVVYRGAFFNLSVTKAAEKLLKTFGRPLKTPEILSAFQEAEYNLKGKHARSVIYTALLRSRDFVKVLPDTWDLAERHPEAAAKKAEELAAKAVKPKKGKKAAKNAAPKAEQPQAVAGLKVA